MKKYEIYFDGQTVLVRNDEGYYYTTALDLITDYERSELTEDEISEYLDWQSILATVDNDFVDKFIEVFGTEVEE